MKKGFLDKVKENAAVQIWSEKTQQEKGDNLTEGYVSQLWDFICISVTQNNLQELEEIWDQWDDETKQLFYFNYGDLSYLLDVKMDKHLFRALAQYWNPTYSCFTFRKIDLVPTVEKYTTLLRYLKIQADKAYSRVVNIPTFLKRLMSITRMTHPDTKKRVNVFALSIYGLVIFPKVLGYIDDAVSNLLDRLDKRNHSPLKEFVATLRRDDILEEKWMAILQSLQDEDFEWKALWMIPDEILYRCADFD
ncbi:hypothetical protein Goarm_023147 [Gossypium armourianum]|uniref:DUF7745 domain-containing protein n=2 Tax=Gossypium armourianum TaxID=34283 RepID=A0A7J9KGB7_9ROSI|nr:hypothetical protein [Gossypium armourianum]